MRILIIEDNDLLQKALVRAVRAVHPHAVTNVTDNAPEAIGHLDKFAYDYIVSDFDLKIGTGGDVLRHVREHFAFYVRCNRFILLTGDIRPAIRSLEHPLTFEKPIETRKLRALLTEGLAP